MARELVVKGFGNERIKAELSEELIRRLTDYEGHCRDLELTGALGRIGHFNVSIKAGMTYQQVMDEVRVLREAIEYDLQYRKFAYVPIEKAARLDKVEVEWADAIRAFPSAHDDIVAAVECYALDCNTACVFHSMRIAERGLRVLSKALKVKTIGPQKHPLEFAEWGQILMALRGKLNAIQNSPGRNAKKSALAKFYADAASQADYLNEIWRKEVSHARYAYNAPEALNALTRTREFMLLLSQKLSER